VHIFSYEEIPSPKPELVLLCLTTCLQQLRNVTGHTAFAKNFLESSCNFMVVALSPLRLNRTLTVLLPGSSKSMA
jgi:hypothetical protein